MTQILFEAENGKVWKRKSTGAVYDRLLVLPQSVSINEFEQVDKPVEEAEENDIDDDIFENENV